MYDTDYRPLKQQIICPKCKQRATRIASVPVSKRNCFDCHVEMINYRDYKNNRTEPMNSNSIPPQNLCSKCSEPLNSPTELCPIPECNTPLIVGYSPATQTPGTDLKPSNKWVECPKCLYFETRS